MSAAVLRLKRKADSEPVEGVVIALKKSKGFEFHNASEVYFKFAATLQNETDSIKEHVQAALSKEKESKLLKWRDPKASAVRQKNASNICERLRKECKALSDKKRLDCHNNRRLIFTETVPVDDDQNSPAQNAEVRELFQLYDIIEETEEPRKQSDVEESAITCNGIPLVREKASDYVYDVYIADGKIDDSFVENTVSLRPYTLTNDDLYSDVSDDDSDIFEDEDDSNDENNWRNEYPEDEDSRSDKESEEEYGVSEDIYYDEIGRSFNQVDLERNSCSDDEPFSYGRILNDIEDENSQDYSD